MNSTHRLRAASLALLATSFIPSLLSQNQFSISITRAFSYQQTASETLVTDQPELVISVSVVPPLNSPPTTSPLTIQAVSNGSTFTLQKDPPVRYTLPDGTSLSLIGETYSFRKPFSDNTELSASLLNPLLTINISSNGTTTSVPIVVATTAPIAQTRILNFNALQEWDGNSFSVFWVPIPGLTELNAPSLVVRNSNNASVYPKSSLAGLPGSFSQVILLGFLQPPNTPGVVIGPARTAQTVNDISSSPGEIFFGTLTTTSVLNSSNNPGTTVSTLQTVAIRFPIKRPSPAPLITTQPQSLTSVTGTTATLAPTITGSGATYVWKKDGTPISGATNATLSITSVKFTDAGAYTVTATNSGGSVTSNAAILTVVAPTIAPTISAAPANLTVLAGDKSTLTVTPAGTEPFTYQWLRNGTPITGATSATLTLDTTLISAAAAYSVTVTNPAGSVTSSAAALVVTPISRISNISVLTSLSSPADTFTLGYVIGGNATTGPKPLLLRAAGPALAALGVAGTLDDPKLELFAGSAKTAENDNWGTSATSTSALATAFTAVGAFPFASPTSRDAAITASLTTRDNSVRISSANPIDPGTGLPAEALAKAGLVLAEIYDATPTDTFTTATPRLLNVSVLKSLGTGLTVGFTIAGSAPKTVLIRAIGPTLGEPPFGVPGTVADPQLALFSPASTTPLATNDNWSLPIASAPNAAALTAAFTATGAFALPSNSRDAALLTTLPPGGYSVQVTGVNTTTGTALVEVYEVP